jgi:TnpA family transposase
MSLTRQRRGDANKLGFSVQLALLRHPGIALAEDTNVPLEVVSWLASRLSVSPEAWDEYGTREETRQEHGREIRAYLGMSAFGIADFRQLVEHVGNVAAQTDKGLLLVEGARDFLRSRKVALPGLSVMERACAQALTKANRNIYATLGGHLSVEHQKHLDGLALALRELGRMERTLFLLDWLQDPGLRRKVTAGLNKGEARNTLARAVFFNRLGEIRDRSFEQQRYRASGLNLLTAAIVLWNTVYLDRTVATLTSGGGDIDPDLLRFLSPLGWEHINLTGDYTWPRANHIKPGKYRPLRHPAKP